MVMKAVHAWMGTEKELAHCYYAVMLTVESISTGKAHGEIKMKDYLDHGNIIIRSWSAMSTGRGTWIILRRTDDTESVEGVIDSTFTPNLQVNAAIENFIAELLLEFTRTGAKMIGPKKYAGPMEEYTGVCVCEKLSRSGVLDAFPWKEITKGKFHERLFICSCGAKWWLDNPAKKQWVLISNETAWRNILAYFGIEIKSKVRSLAPPKPGEPDYLRKFRDGFNTVTH
jgi:hypothetical protein